MACAHHAGPRPAVRNLTLLATSRALLRAADDDLHVVRMLIDQGSELTFITEELVQRCKLKRGAASIPLIGVGGAFVGRTRGIVSIHLQSVYDSSSHCTISAYVLPRLMTRLPPFDANCHTWPHVDGLQLADPDFGRSGPINILLGSDFYGSIIMPGFARGDASSPVAQQTIFGWVLSGPVPADQVTSSPQVHLCSPGQELQELLSRFWKQEDTPAAIDSIRNPEEEECEQHFFSTHCRDTSRRYVVRLPFKSDPSTLGESRNRAVGCLKRLSKRLSSDPEFKQLYVNFVEEYETLGHMTRAAISNTDLSPIFYLPHHGILRPASSTTKLRVVFNGSRRTSNGVSLNDFLHTGAKLQRDIADVLLWTRTHRVLFSTDIVKMYRQIAVHREDWDLQRILWLDKNDRPVDYHLTTVTYGLSCAPFLALRALQQLIIDEGHRFPRAVPPLTKGTYVDDIFGGADSVSEARKIIDQLNLLCEAGKFPLQKWNSSHSDLVPRSNEESASSVTIEPTLTKILGLVWEFMTDTFHFTVKPERASAPTKRTIASDIAKLYDPLGLISPVLIRAKIVLQELWLHKVKWDEPLPPDVCQRWRNFRRDLLQLDQLSIPRWLGLHGACGLREIHGFSDASPLAMAGTVYVRVATDLGKFSVLLVCSKTRVAPLKRLTTPQLGLSAALILARLMRHTSEARGLSDVPLLCWTDSSVAYTWITSHPSRW